MFICRQAPLWLMLSATMERMTQRSSMQPATWGNSSLTSMPLWPCLPNLNGDGSRLPGPGAHQLRLLERQRLAAFWARRGLGSNVSTCDGPPDMKRKITRLARAGNMRRLDGQRVVGVGGARPLSAASRPARPIMPKPLAKCAAPARRLRGGVESCKGFMRSLREKPGRVTALQST